MGFHPVLHSLGNVAESLVKNFVTYLALDIENNFEDSKLEIPTTATTTKAMETPTETTPTTTSTPSTTPTQISSSDMNSTTPSPPTSSAPSITTNSSLSTTSTSSHRHTSSEETGSSHSKHSSSFHGSVTAISSLTDTSDKTLNTSSVTLTSTTSSIQVPDPLSRQDPSMSGSGPIASATQSHKEQPHSKGLIAGAVIGTVMGLVFISLAIFCFKKHRRSSRHAGSKEDREEITEFAKPSIRGITSHGSISAIASSLGTPRTSATIGHQVTYNLGFEDSARLMEQGVIPAQTLVMSMPHSEPSPLDLNMPHTPPTILSAVEHAPYPFIYQKPPRSPSDYATSRSQTASQVESVSTASEAGVIIPRPPGVHLNFPTATEPDNVDVAVSEILRAMAAQKRQKRQQSISGRLSRSSLLLPFEPFEHPDQTSTDYRVLYDHHNDTPSLVHSNGSPESTWNGYHEN